VLIAGAGTPGQSRASLFLIFGAPQLGLSCLMRTIQRLDLDRQLIGMAIGPRERSVSPSRPVAL